jgi:phosphate starvation-inducible protein PhoH
MRDNERKHQISMRLRCDLSKRDAAKKVWTKDKSMDKWQRKRMSESVNKLSANGLAAKSTAIELCGLEQPEVKLSNGSGSCVKRWDNSFSRNVKKEEIVSIKTEEQRSTWIFFKIDV